MLHVKEIQSSGYYKREWAGWKLLPFSWMADSSKPWITQTLSTFWCAKIHMNSLVAMNGAFVCLSRIFVQLHTFLPCVCAAFIHPHCIDQINKAVADQALTSSLPAKLKCCLWHVSSSMKTSFSFQLLKLTSYPWWTHSLVCSPFLDVTFIKVSHPKGTQWQSTGYVVDSAILASL